MSTNKAGPMTRAMMPYGFSETLLMKNYPMGMRTKDKFGNPVVIHGGSVYRLGDAIASDSRRVLDDWSADIESYYIELGSGILMNFCLEARELGVERWNGLAPDSPHSVPVYEINFQVHFVSPSKKLPTSDTLTIEEPLFKFTGQCLKMHLPLLGGGR